MFPETFTLLQYLMATGLCKEIAACNLNVLLRPGGSFYSLWFQSTALNTYNPRIFLPLSDGFLKGGAADVSGCVHTYKHKLSNSTFNPFIFSLGAKQYTHGHGGQICGCTFISCQCRRIFSKHAWQVSRLGLLLNGIKMFNKCHFKNPQLKGTSDVFHHYCW